MASRAPLADNEERLFWCAVCRERLTDPKLLPCLHRFCRHCLEDVIANSRGDSFRCPLCEQKHKILKEGVDGYKTDFYTKGVADLLQLQSSFREDDVRKCHGCKKVKKVVAFCFKCSNFLCEQCYDFHLNNDMIVEHRPHTLDLTKVDMSNLTLDALTSLTVTEDPRCATHVKHLAQLCCVTCDNLPICVACTHGGHTGHETHEYKTLAASEREKLVAVLSKLRMHEAALYELPKRVETAQRKLEANVRANIEKVEFEHQRASAKISAKAEANRAEIQRSKREIEERREKDCNEVRQACQREMEKVKQKYNRIWKEKGGKYDKETEQVESKHGKIDDNLSAKTDKLDEKLKNCKGKITASQEQIAQELKGIADHSEHTINRYENFTVTSSTVLASNDEWTDARYLPDINAASEPLIEDVTKEVKISDSSLWFVDKVTVTEKEESVVDVEGMKGRDVRGITSSKDGHIIITGNVTGTSQSHITIINRKGGIVGQGHVERVAGSIGPRRYCDYLSQSLIATACQSNQVGICDVKTGKHVRKNIKEINTNWLGYVTCVATDDENNIYVGGNIREVLIFDDKLNYRRTLTLPGIIKSPWDMTVHGGHLLICDLADQQAYAVTMEGTEAKLVHQFIKPDLRSPISVCTDSNGFVYMLWLGSGTILTQYSQDGRELLATQRVDGDAWCMTTIETDGKDKLLIATQSSGKLYMYGLQ